MQGSSAIHTVLVVEDADSVRKMVCGMLTMGGYHVLQAADGIEALKLIEESSEAVDLVLTDMVMPNMSGPELARQLARKMPGVRVMFMSGYTDDPIIRNLGLSPMTVLPKPFTASALLDKVGEVLMTPWKGIPKIAEE